MSLLTLSPPTQVPPNSKPQTVLATDAESSSSPQVSVVIVNYHQWGETADLIRQLGRSTSLATGKVEIVVVDNHSPKNPIAGWLRRRRGVSLRRWSKNRGFACAVNEGCRLSQGGWFLLLNSDMTVREGFLDGVLALAHRLEQENPRMGILGFQLRNSDGSRQWSTGPFPTLWGTLSRLVLPRSRRKYHALRARKLTHVSWVTGCCLLLRRECMQDLGGLDQRFFLYYEDIDLCRRARDRGWTVGYEPSLRVTHHRPLHSRSLAVAMRVLTRHALLTYASKHWPTWQFRLLARIVEAEAIVRNQWKLWKGDYQKADQLAVLEAIASEMATGNSRQARRRLLHFIRKHEQVAVPECRLQAIEQ
jgi:N-acetylglucosaminyl-diphospho-decaprenol L-rhamnosyltransferase